MTEPLPQQPQPQPPQNPARQLTPAQLTIVISAAVSLLSSFLPWIDSEFTDSLTPWSDNLLFPTFAWPALIAIAMGAVILVETFSTVRPRPMIFGFTWPQIHFILALFAVVITVSFLIGGEEHGAGFFLAFLASVGLLVGAIMLRNEHVAE